ncbi:cupin domain-containing protein [Enterococcus sp. UD-01]|jgi:predicted cupin superfamily sugar epimerase|uniref:cupin domain-containing protein n=1 Tax=Enterococcus sp. UD-01 TaxID=3373911 RepID=UPI00383275BD
MLDKQYWIDKLGLVPHQEGGFYKELPASNDWLADKNRPLYTNIYFLLTEDSPSHFHQLTADEVWYFHYGSSLKVHELRKDGSYKETSVGLNIEQGDVLQYVVEKGTIFGSSVNKGDTYALVSCMVAPGFTFEDFKLFTKEELLEKYPENYEIIDRLAFEKISKE